MMIRVSNNLWNPWYWTPREWNWNRSQKVIGSLQKWNWNPNKLDLLAQCPNVLWESAGKMRETRKSLRRPFQGNIPRVRKPQAPSSGGLTKNNTKMTAAASSYYQHTLAYTKRSTKKHTLIPSIFSPFQISQKAGQTMKSQQDLMQKGRTGFSTTKVDPPNIEKL